MVSSDNSESGDRANGRPLLPSAPKPIRGAGCLIRRQRTVQADWGEVERFLRRLSGELAPSPYSVCVVSDRAMRRYNQRFRHRDEPTDVLSFPAEPARNGGPEYLGDILISAETALDNATRYRIRLEDEMKVLALHGLLHLLGYDHENDGGQMARQEKRWAVRLGLPQTLLARARAGRDHTKTPSTRPR